MQRVNTVLGPVSPDDLGPTLVHEHIMTGYPGWQGDATLAPFDRQAMLASALAILAQVKACGVKTYVDATPNDLGRDPQFLAEVSARSGLNIVCATGYYFEAAGASPYFRFRSRWADVPAEIHEMFMREITDGIAGSGIKAGVIKLASGKGAISDYERMFFKAAAKAQRETGVPIITHTQEGTMGPEQAELLIAEGADPARIMIGHMSDNTDLRYHLHTLAQGVTIAFDRMGMQGFGSFPLDSERCACLMGLIGAGYARQITISHDCVLSWICGLGLGRPVVFPEHVQRCIANWHPTHLFKNVIPALKAGGVSDGEIGTILVDNPRRLFGGE